MYSSTQYIAALFAFLSLASAACPAGTPLRITNVQTAPSQGSNGWAFASASGGSPPYSYSTANAAGTIVSTSQNATALPPAMNFVVYITDACNTRVSLTFDIGSCPTASPAPSPAPTNAPPVCSPCPNHPGTLPTVPYIPGDNSCNATQRQVLVDLYVQLGGPNWINSANWLVGDPCAQSWFGVACNQNGVVVNIDLHNNNLVGNQIPPSIGCLPNLQGLVLDNNRISGQLPLNLCKLTNIKYLTIGNNNLGGTIPACFSNLIHLIELYLHDNGLTGSLPNITGYVALKELVVNNNCLSGEIPQYIVGGATLIDLTFDNNFFQGCIPDQYRNFGTFSGNLYCSGPIPVWTTDAALGCVGAPPRRQVCGDSHCPNTACMSEF